MGGIGGQRLGFCGARLDLEGSAKCGRRATTQARYGAPGDAKRQQASPDGLWPGNHPVESRDEPMVIAQDFDIQRLTKLAICTFDFDVDTNRFVWQTSMQ
jgi:hypothetical protein